MLFRGLNDYELIYLIRENNEVALNLMYEKYGLYIRKIIKEFHVRWDLYDDFYAEGLIALDAALKTFNPDYNKTFFKYYELILKRSFIKLYNKAIKYDIPMSNVVDVMDEEVSYHSNIAYDYIDLFDDEIEKLVYKEIYIKGNNCRNISKMYNIQIKKVYNIVYKIKNVLNKAFNID